MGEARLSEYHAAFPDLGKVLQEHIRTGALSAKLVLGITSAVNAPIAIAGEHSNHCLPAEYASRRLVTPSAGAMSTGVTEKG